MTDKILLAFLISFSHFWSPQVNAQSGSEVTLTLESEMRAMIEKYYDGGWAGFHRDVIDFHIFPYESLANGSVGVYHLLIKITQDGKIKSAECISGSDQRLKYAATILFRDRVNLWKPLPKEINQLNMLFTIGYHIEEFDTELNSLVDITGYFGDRQIGNPIPMTKELNKDLHLALLNKEYDFAKEIITELLKRKPQDETYNKINRQIDQARN